MNLAWLDPRARREAVQAKRGVCLGMGWRYLAGPPGLARPGPITVFFKTDGISFSQIKGKKLIPWSDVRDVAIEGPGQVAKRVTVTRLLTTGIFAFALKKKEREAFVVITTGDGEIILRSDKMTPMEARVKLHGFLGPRESVTP